MLGEGAVVLPGTQGVRFRVYAPGAVTVAVAGEFNNWSTTANMMTRDAEGYYATTVASARVGHRYKFVVNGTLWRKDPWSLQVEGSSEGSNSIIVDLTAYQRRATNWQTPRIEELAIYQLHLKGFQYNADGLTYRHGRVFRDFIDTKLDYLTDLGVNCIHIMPMHEFPGEDSWGYNPVFFHAPESSYGTPEEFQELVDACHERGIAVIVDIVYNHTAGTDNTHFWDFDGTADNPHGGNRQFYYNDTRALTFWGPEPNYGHPRTRARFFENVRVMAELYRVDGFRMDAVGFVRGESTDGNDWAGWQADDGWAFLRDFNNLARSYHNTRFLSIAEDIATNASITQNTSEGGAGFLSQWTETDLRQIMANPSDAARNNNAIRRIIERFYPINYGLYEMVKYHSSHDKVGALNDGPRLPVLIGDPNAWYARRRTALANALIMFSPGTPLFFMGDEKYETRSFTEQAGTALDWTLRDRNRGFYEFSRDLFMLKRQARALHHNNYQMTAANDGENLISWRRWGVQGEVLVIAANFSAFDKDFWIDFPSNGRWFQIINSMWTHYGEFDSNNNPSFEVSNNWASVRIPGYSIIVMSTTHELPPGRVWQVTPEDEGFANGATVALKWGATARAESYAVYVGNTRDAVAAATPASPEYRGRVTGTEHLLEAMTAGQVVFWRIDAINGIGTSQSEVFSFRDLEDDSQVDGRITWRPAQPRAGGSVTITYRPNPALTGLSPITIHRGFRIGGVDWRETIGQPMTDRGDGTHEVNVAIPTNAEAMNLVFNYQAQIWDNNGQQDWRIPVQPGLPLGIIVY